MESLKDLPDSLKMVIPVVAAKKNGEKYGEHRYLGCGFFLDGNGLFTTCAHVVRAKKEDEILFLMPANTNKLFFIDAINIHPQFDFAILKTRLKLGDSLMVDESELSAGADVYSFGFHNSRKEGDGIMISFQIFKGYISSVWLQEKILEAERSVYQLSFPVLNGFSGSPLFHDKKICGMLFVNRETSITVAHSKFEETVRDENKTTVTIEKIQRIYEAGIAHKITDILKWARTQI